MCGHIQESGNEAVPPFQLYGLHTRKELKGLPGLKWYTGYNIVLWPTYSGWWFWIHWWCWGWYRRLVADNLDGEHRRSELHQPAAVERAQNCVCVCVVCVGKGGRGKRRDVIQPDHAASHVTMQPVTWSCSQSCDQNHTHSVSMPLPMVPMNSVLLPSRESTMLVLDAFPPDLHCWSVVSTSSSSEG